MKKQSKILSILLAASLTFGSISLPSDPPSPASGASDPVQTDSITITPDPSLAPADARKDLANIFFQTHSQGGTATDNISKNNYAVYARQSILLLRKRRMAVSYELSILTLRLL